MNTPAIPGAPPPQIFALINSLTESRVLVGSCNAVLVWEWLTCLPLEYRYIWRAEVRFTTIVFLLLRYFTFVAMDILTWLFFWNGSEEACQKMIVCIQALPAIVLALAHTLIAVRVYALYDKNHYILAFLGTLVAAQLALHACLSTLITAVPRMTPLISYCLPQSRHQYALAWGFPLGYDTVVLILAGAKLTSIWRAGGRSRLVQVLFRDQVLWYILMTIVSILNLVVAYATPSPAGSKGRGIVSSVLVTLTSISACRVVLNIRQTADEDRTRVPSSGHTGHSDASKNNSNRFTMFGSTKQGSRNPPSFTSNATAPRKPASPAFKVQSFSNSMNTPKYSGKEAGIEEEVDDGRDIELGDAGRWNGGDHYAR